MALNLPTGWQDNEKCVILFLTTRRQMIALMRDAKVKCGKHPTELLPEPQPFPVEELENPQEEEEPAPAPEEEMKQPEHYVMLPKLLNSCGVVIGAPFQSTAQRKLYHNLGKLLVKHNCAKRILKSGTYAITDWAGAKEWIMAAVAQPNNKFKLKMRYLYH